MSVSDIERLQAVGKEAQAARHEFILKDDQDAVWNHFKSLNDARVDIVLDNCALVICLVVLTANSFHVCVQLGSRWVSLLTVIFPAHCAVPAVYRSGICRLLGYLYPACQCRCLPVSIEYLANHISPL